MPSSSHSVLREGAVAGAIGATAVAVWFFIVDLIGGRPLFTPQILGAGLMSVFGQSPEPAAVNVIAYTIFHYAVFILVGMLAVFLVHAGERRPSVLARSVRSVPTATARSGAP